MMDSLKWFFFMMIFLSCLWDGLMLEGEWFILDVDVITPILRFIVMLSCSYLYEYGPSFSCSHVNWALSLDGFCSSPVGWSRGAVMSHFPFLIIDNQNHHHN
jgi:hypothetical protein